MSLNRFALHSLILICTFKKKHQKGDNNGLRTIEVDLNTRKSAEVDVSKDLKEGVLTADAHNLHSM